MKYMLGESEVSTYSLLSGACAEHQVAYIGEALRGKGRLDCLGAVELGSGLVWC